MTNDAYRTCPWCKDEQVMPAAWRGAPIGDVMTRMHEAVCHECGHPLETHAVFPGSAVGCTEGFRDGHPCRCQMTRRQIRDQAKAVSL